MVAVSTNRLPNCPKANICARRFTDLKKMDATPIVVNNITDLKEMCKRIRRNTSIIYHDQKWKGRRIDKPESVADVYEEMIPTQQAMGETKIQEKIAKIKKNNQYLAGPVKVVYDSKHDIMFVKDGQHSLIASLFMGSPVKMILTTVMVTSSFNSFGCWCAYDKKGNRKCDVVKGLSKEIQQYKSDKGNCPVTLSNEDDPLGILWGMFSRDDPPLDHDYDDYDYKLDETTVFRRDQIADGILAHIRLHYPLKEKDITHVPQMQIRWKDRHAALTSMIKTASDTVNKMTFKLHLTETDRQFQILGQSTGSDKWKLCTPKLPRGLNNSVFTKLVNLQSLLDVLAKKEHHTFEGIGSAIGDLVGTCDQYDDSLITWSTPTSSFEHALEQYARETQDMQKILDYVKNSLFAAKQMCIIKLAKSQLVQDIRDFILLNYPKKRDKAMADVSRYRTSFLRRRRDLLACNIIYTQYYDRSAKKQSQPKILYDMMQSCVIDSDNGIKMSDVKGNQQDIYIQRFPTNLRELLTEEQQMERGLVGPLEVMRAGYHGLAEDVVAYIDKCGGSMSDGTEPLYDTNNPEEQKENVSFTCTSKRPTRMIKAKNVNVQSFLTSISSLVQSMIISQRTHRKERKVPYIPGTSLTDDIQTDVVLESELWDSALEQVPIQGIADAITKRLHDYPVVTTLSQIEMDKALKAIRIAEELVQKERKKKTEFRENLHNYNLLNLDPTLGNVFSTQRALAKFRIESKDPSALYNRNCANAIGFANVCTKLYRTILDPKNNELFIRSGYTRDEKDMSLIHGIIDKFIRGMILPTFKFSNNDREVDIILSTARDGDGIQGAADFCSRNCSGTVDDVVYTTSVDEAVLVASGPPPPPPPPPGPPPKL
jgi:hypothetical protein